MGTPSNTGLTRRFVLLNAAGAGLAAAVNVPARASISRGLVGNIKPRAADSSLVDMIKLLPDGIGVIPVYMNVTPESREDGSVYPMYEERLVYLASQKCNLIAIEGAPPFLRLGPKGEAEMVDSWKRKYNIDMFTAPRNQVNAFRALKAKRILGLTAGAGGPDVNKVYTKYFEDSGLGVVAMERMAVELDSAQDVPPAAITAVVKKAFAEHKGADAVYLLGPAVEALPLIAPLERELGVPVVQAIVARVWEIQKRLKVHEPIKGYGRLLETLPT
jgi:maleate cis-trans isomerase